MVQAKAKLKKKALAGKQTRTKGYICCGFDISMSSIAGAAFGYDSTMKLNVGPITVVKRWERKVDYFTRLADAARGVELVHALIAGLKMTPELDEIYIAVEEPFSFGHVGRMQSSAIKQQAQISGAFLGGLVRYGYNHVFEINNVRWRMIVAEALGITIHPSKWNPDKVIGKFRAKQWVENKWPGRFDYPDLVAHTSRGLIPKPPESKARARQSDDRYEAIAIAEYMRSEVERTLGA
jgi:hypothetical protein